MGSLKVTYEKSKILHTSILTMCTTIVIGNVNPSIIDAACGDEKNDIKKLNDSAILKIVLAGFRGNPQMTFLVLEGASQSWIKSSFLLCASWNLQRLPLNDTILSYVVKIMDDLKAT